MDAGGSPMADWAREALPYSVVYQVLPDRVDWPCPESVLP